MWRGFTLKTVAIIVARLSCARLPGKALLDLGGQPLLEYTLERAQRVHRVDEIVLATSDDASDQPLADYAEKAGLPVYRGSLADVAGRVLGAATSAGAGQFLRVNGDSPWIDPGLLDMALDVLESSPVDLATNIFPRTFPAGVSVEAVRTAAFRRACERMTGDSDREHVTRFFYQHPSEFRIHNIESGRDWGSLHLAVDTAEDLALAERVVGRMKRPHTAYSTDEIVALYRVVAEHRETAQ